MAHRTKSVQAFGPALTLVFSLSAVFSNSSIALTVDNFAVTENSYAWNADMNAAVVSEYGDQYRMADWNDIVTFFNEGNDMTPLLDLLRPTREWVSRNGQGMWSGNRHYFVNVSDHSTPPGFLVHDHIDNHLIDLGSWFNPRPILAFTPVPLPPAGILFAAALPLIMWRVRRRTNTHTI